MRGGRAQRHADGAGQQQRAYRVDRSFAALHYSS
jgi:hypothetical protein